MATIARTVYTHSWFSYEDQLFNPCILGQARDEVAKMLEESNGQQQELSRFLELHYPFFDNDVQKVTNERHPSKKHSPYIEYAADACLWAEQYAWMAYGPNKNILDFSIHAEFFFVNDLNWFSRLLVAITAGIEAMLKVDPAYPRNLGGGLGAGDPADHSGVPHSRDFE